MRDKKENRERQERPRQRRGERVDRIYNSNSLSPLIRKDELDFLMLSIVSFHHFRCLSLNPLNSFFLFAPFDPIVDRWFFLVWSRFGFHLACGLAFFPFRLCERMTERNCFNQDVNPVRALGLCSTFCCYRRNKNPTCGGPTKGF